MNAWPIIERELRAQSRNPMNHWIRVIGAGVLLLACMATGWVDWEAPADYGMRLFGSLNAVIFLSIWLLAPLMTADCISGERRDDTLVLLFLTPLTATSIVIGKILAHGLRAMTILLVALPVLAIPLVIGGVTYTDLATAAMLDCAAIFMGMAAGLIASSVSKEWARVLIFAEILALVFALMFGAGVKLILEELDLPKVPVAVGAARMVPIRLGGGQVIMVSQARVQGMFQMGHVRENNLALRLCTNLGGKWSELMSNTAPGAERKWLQGVASVWLAGLLMLALAICVGADLVRRVWRDQPLTRQRAWVKKTFCKPAYWRVWLKGKSRHALERNPIGWLQQYSWNARLTKWGWCLALIIVEIGSGMGIVSWEFQFNLAIALCAGLALASSASFMEEKRSGALELMLVTPLSPRQLVAGRLRGLWAQFLPAMGLVGFAWIAIFVTNAHVFGGEWAKNGWLIPVWLALIPIIGIWASMRFRNVLIAWLVTSGLSFALFMLPKLVMAIGWQDQRIYGSGVGTFFGVEVPWGTYFTLRTMFGGWLMGILIPVALQVGLARYAWMSVHRNLTQRRFAIGKV